MKDLSEYVVLHDTTLVTDTRRIAKHFRKQHKNVLQSYDNLECSEEFNRLNFQPVEEGDEKGEKRRVIRMTKDGFMFLVFGFRGSEAAKIKEAYILAFNAMAEQLQAIAIDGYRSFWDQRLDLEKRDSTSFMWASFGSKCMLNRKLALPAIREERERLEHEMEPSLWNSPLPAPMYPGVEA